MDYLDPLKKRRKKYNLMVMYALLGVAIAIATVLLVYLVNGYSIDRQTGQVIQNGLIYLDSKPESAEVYLNGEKQRGRTDARLVVPSGTYDIALHRTGYREWRRNLVLEGGSLRRLTYARLVPEVLDSELALNLPAALTMASQSGDKRWLVLALTDNPLLLRLVDMNRAPLQLTDLPLPPNALDTKAAGVWRVIDWADDNKTFLAAYTTATTTEYVLIDREDPAKLKKLNQIFSSISIADVGLRARKNDLLYLFDASSKTLYSANANDGSTQVVLQDALDFKSFGDDTLLYISTKDAKPDMVVSMLKVGGNTYKLRDLKQHSSYLLDISKIGSLLVAGVGSPAENRVIIYSDPVGALKKNDFSTIPVPATVLRVDNPEELSISADSSIIAVRGGQSIASHEFEADRSYSFKWDAALDPDQKLRWIDGQHMLLSSGGRQFMVDFDGSNRYELVESSVSLGGYTDGNFNFLYTFPPSIDQNNPFRLMRTFMRTAGDR